MIELKKLDNGFEYIVGARLKSQTRAVTEEILEQTNYNILSISVYRS